MNSRQFSKITKLTCAIAVAILICGLPLGQIAAQERVINPAVGLVYAHQSSQAAADSGAGWEIVYFRWDQLQPGGPSEWNAEGPTDTWLDTARNQGREVVGLLIGTPGWATEGDAVTGVPTGLYLPIDDPGNTWAVFVRQVVNYGTTRGINRWVIWEDVDIPPGVRGSTWDGTLEEYYQLLRTAYLVARQANPNAEIHLAGTGTYDPAWFGRFLDGMIDDPSVPLKRVWINETNARPAIDPEVYTDETEFREYLNITQEQQAAFIIQAYALGLAAGAERVGVYRLADDLTEDNGQAFGLVRADGSPRPAYTAYQVMAREFNGAIYKRRVDEETHPLVEYVRLTFATKVTHVIWSRTDRNVTLVIPARSTQATLIDMFDNRWIVEPQGGEYRIAVGAATCNEPSAPSGCLIGGPPLLLVEEDVPNPLNTTAPSVSVIAGGTPLTPVPGAHLTATAQAQPTATPSPIPPTETPTPVPPSQTPTAEDTPEPPAEATEVIVPTQAEVAEMPTQPQPPTQSAPVRTRPPGSPTGFMAVLPYLMMGLGAVVVAGGAVYFLGVWPRRASQAMESFDTEWDGPSEDDASWNETDQALDGTDE